MVSFENSLKTSIAAGLSVCVALAWNKCFEEFLSVFKFNNIIGYLIYAILLSIFTSIITLSFQEDKLSIPSIWGGKY